jgi:hypothetical protein
MWTLAFVVVVVVVVAVAVILIRRPRAGDAHSVQNYNHALGTLEHLSERIGPPVVRPVRVVPGDRPGLAAPIRATVAAEPPPTRVPPVPPVPPVPVRGTDEFPDPDAPIVFDDAHPVERGRPFAATEPTTPPRTDRSQRIALASMNHRRRPGTGISIVIAVVIVFATLAIIGSHRSHKTSGGTHSSTTTTRPPHAHTTTTTVPRSTTTTRPPATTLPTQYVATTASTTGAAAAYTLPHTTYQITLTATGTCWAQVTAVATGSTVWAGLLKAGQVQHVQASGATTVGLGAPDVSLQVDALPVVLPTPLHTPFVATFTPSATATPGTTPTSTVPGASTASSRSTGSTTTTTTTPG